MFFEEHINPYNSTSAHLVCSLLFCVLSIIIIIAELPRRRCASKAPFLRKFGNPSSRENLVLTSPYERATERTFVKTLGEGEGSLKNAIFS